MEEERKILRSYNKLKNFEIKIYRLGNTTIPFPLPITTTVYFFSSINISCYYRCYNWNTHKFYI